MTGEGVVVIELRPKVGVEIGVRDGKVVVLTSPGEWRRRNEAAMAAAVGEVPAEQLAAWASGGVRVKLVVHEAEVDVRWGEGERPAAGAVVEFTDGERSVRAAVGAAAGG